MQASGIAVCDVSEVISLVLGCLNHSLQFSDSSDKRRLIQRQISKHTLVRTFDSFVSLAVSNEPSR